MAEITQKPQVTVIDVDPQHLKIVRAVLARHLPFKTVWAYGSRVKWNATERSDLDCVVFDATASQVAEATEALMECEAPFEVQLLVWEDLPDNFKTNIQQQYFVLQQGRMTLTDWQETTLGEVITLQRGFDLPTQQRQNGIYPLITSSGQDGFHSEYKVNAPGVVTGRSGTLGKTFFVKEAFWPLNTTLWVKDFHGNSPEYVYYFLKTLSLENQNSGSGVPTLNRNHIHPMPVLLPPLPEQRAIADVLSSLDAKIDLLHRQNQTLEALAETLFRQCFIEEANPDWEEGTLGDIVSIGSGKSLKKEYFDENGSYPILGANGKIGRTNQFLFDEKIIFTGRVGTLGNIFISEGKVWLSDNTLIIKPFNQYYFYWVYLFLKNEKLGNYNVGSTQPLIRQSDVKELAFTVPPHALLNNFSSYAETTFQKIKENQQQIQTLERLRDALLPKLMAGSVRVGHCGEGEV